MFASTEYERPELIEFLGKYLTDIGGVYQRMKTR